MRFGTLFVTTLALVACEKARPSDAETAPSPIAVSSSPATPPAPSSPASSQPASSPAASSPAASSPAASSPPQARAVPDAAPRPDAARAPKKRYVVFALGDSITAERNGGGGYLRALRHFCPKSEFVDFGRGGDMTNQMRARFESDVAPLVRARGATTLLVYGGVNDLYSDQTAGRSNDRIEADLSAIYRSAKERGLEVVALTVSPWGGFTRYFNARRSENTRLLNSWILGRVSAGDVRVAVDTYPLLSCGEPEKLCLDYQARRPDGLHPGPLGHERLGRAVFEKAFADCE